MQAKRPLRRGARRSGCFGTLAMGFLQFIEKNHALGRKTHTKWKDSLVICVFYFSLYWSFIFFRATVDVFTKEIEVSKTSLSSERKDR